MEEQLLTVINKIEKINFKFDKIFNSNYFFSENAQLKLKKLKLQTKNIYSDLKAIKLTLNTVEKSFLLKTDPNYINIINQINQKIERLILTFNENINIPYLRIIENEFKEIKKKDLLTQPDYQNIKSTLSLEYLDKGTNEIIKQTESLISLTLNRFLTRIDEKINKKFEGIQNKLDEYKIEQFSQFQNILQNQDFVINYLNSLKNPQNINDLLDNELISGLLNQIHDNNLDLNKKLDLIGAEILKNKCRFSFQLQKVYYKKEIYIVEDDFEVQIEIEPMHETQASIENILINQQPKNCFLENKSLFFKKLEKFYKLDINNIYDTEERFLRLNIFAPNNQRNLQIIIKGSMIFSDNSFPFISETFFSIKKGSIKKEKIKTYTKKAFSFILKKGLNVSALFLPP